MASEKLRSKPILKLVIFALIGTLLSIGVILVFVFTDNPFPVKVIIWIFCSIFAIVGLVLLWTQLFHFVEIKDDRLVRHLGFIKKSIKFSEIDKIDNKDGLFDIIVDGKRFATLTTDDTNTQQILLFLEKRRVKINW